MLHCKSSNPDIVFRDRIPFFMQKVLDAAVFPACPDVAHKDGIAGGKIFYTDGICPGPSRLESAKK